MKGFTLYRADCKENAKNTIYNIKCSITSEKALNATVLFDHVGCEYKNGHRGKEDFICSDVVPMDLDNDHSDDSDDWKTVDDVAEAFPDVEFYYIESRNHMKVKYAEDGTVKEARPKYHFYFPIEKTSDPAEYEKLKKDIGALFPYFDCRCGDIAHFFFAVPVAKGGVIE